MSWCWAEPCSTTPSSSRKSAAWQLPIHSPAWRTTGGCLRFWRPRSSVRGARGRSFALLLFDLDDLKKINDKYGHLTGSHAIKRLGNALRSNSRTIDTPARYGGDEFAVILPEIGEEAAKGVAERICARLATDGQLPHGNGQRGSIRLPDRWSHNREAFRRRRPGALPHEEARQEKVYA